MDRRYAKTSEGMSRPPRTGLPGEPVAEMHQGRQGSAGGRVAEAGCRPHIGRTEFQGCLMIVRSLNFTTDGHHVPPREGGTSSSPTTVRRWWTAPTR